jgi:hypothetical protein
MLADAERSRGHAGKCGAALSKAAASRRFNTTLKTVAKWVERFRTGGVDGSRDCSFRPLSLPSQTAPSTRAVVEALRRLRHIGKQSFFPRPLHQQTCTAQFSQQEELSAMKPYRLLAALAVIMIASRSVADAQTATLTANSPGITHGPWTSAKPGSSKSQCSPGEYAVGLEIEGAPPGAKPCVGCVSRLRVICLRYGI